MTELHPKPGPRKGFEKLGEAAVEAGEALKKLGTKVDAVKPPFVRKPHLTQRPFVNPALVSLRDGMQRSVKIKNK